MYSRWLRSLRRMLGLCATDSRRERRVRRGHSRQLLLERLEDRTVPATFVPQAALIATPGNQPFSEAIGDLNGSGKQDIVFGNGATPGVLSVEMGNGDGTFQSAGTISIGASIGFVRDVALVNLDGGPFPDLVAAAFSGNKVVILQNTTTQVGAAPTFAVADTISVGSQPFWITTGDFDGDGKRDIVTGNFSGSSITILPNTTTTPGDITFGTPLTIATPSGCRAVETIEINGKLDLVTANMSNGTVSIFQNTSTGPGNISFTLASTITLPSGSAPNALAIADFNNDGLPDIAVGSFSTGNIYLLLNQGNGTFSSPTTIASPGGANTPDLIAGDFNGDGNTDVAAVDSTTKTVSVLYGNGAGAFPTVETYATGTQPWKVASGDFNGDGAPDLVVANLTDDTATVLLNQTAANALQVTPSTTTPNVATNFTVAVTAQTGGTTYQNYNGTVTLTDSNGATLGSHTFVPADHGAYTFTVSLPSVGADTLTASDGTLTGTAQLNSVDPALTLSPGPMPADTVNVLYNTQTISASGGTGPLTLTTNVQNAVAGLVIPSTGAGSIDITGTPTATGTETFTVTATDAFGGTTTANYAILVNGAVTLSPTTLPVDLANAAYNQTITASGGTGVITLAVSDIQNAIAGLNVPSSGTASLVIGGAPTATGTETFTVTATDSLGGAATAHYAVTVVPTLSNVSITTPADPDLPATLSGSILDSNPQDAFTLVVNWGDSSAAQTFNYAAGTTTFSETHAYATPGTYPVSLALGESESPGAVLYGSIANGPGNSDGQLYSFNLATGAATLVGSLPGSSVTEIAYDNFGRQALLEFGGGAAEGQQFDIGAGAAIGAPIDNSPAETFQGLAFDGATLYAAGTTGSGPTSPSELRILNPTTGTSTVIGPTTLSGPLSGLAFDPNTGILYGIRGGNVSTNNLVSLNLTTGAATVLFSTGFAAGSLGFGPDGQLYAGSNTGQLFNINLATQAVTLVGTAGSGSALSGLALVDAAPLATAATQVTVNPALALSPGTLPADTINVGYNLTLTAGGGTGAITLAVSNIQNAIPGLVIPSSGIGSLVISGTPAATGTETFTVTATDALGGTATTNYSIMVNPADQTITFTAPTSPIGFVPGATVALNATASSDDTVAFSIDASSTGSGSINGNTLTVTGAGTIVLDANQAGDSNFNAAAQVQQTVVVNPAPQTITFTAPTTPITFANNETVSLNAGASSGDAVTFSIDASSTGSGSISGNTLTVTGAGTIVLDANQTGDSNFNAAPQMQQALVVNAAPQTITFTAPTTPITFAPNETVSLNASASSGDGVTFSIDASSTGSGSISGNTLTVTGAGTIVLDANQTGDSNFNAAPQVQQALVVNPAPQTITFTAPTTPITFAPNETVSLNASASSGDAVTFSIDASSTGSGSISGNTLTVTGAGTIVLDANQPGDSNYNAAPQVQQALVVNPAPQTITFTAPTTPITFAPNETVSLNASASSGDAVTFSIDPSSTGSGSIDGNTLTITGAGTIVLDANQAGDSNFNAAAQVQQSLVVNEAITLSSPALPAGSINVPYAQVITASGGTGAITLTVSDIQNAVPGLNVPGSGTTNLAIGGTPTGAGTETFMVTATDDARGTTGPQQYSVTVNPLGELTLSPVTLTPCALGSNYGPIAFSASGGFGAYTFTSNKLPAGLNLSSSGALTGTPTTAGTFTFTIVATDNSHSSLTGQLKYSMPVTPALVVSPATLPVATAGDSFSTQLKASGGSGSGYVFTASALPDGLTLSSSGLLSGIPTNATGAPFPFTVTATDSNSAARSFGYALTIDPALTLSPGSLAVATVGDNFITQLTATGGAGKGYIFTSTVLPSWLRLSSTGRLTGTPPATAASSANFTVTVADGLKGTGSASYTLNVDPALVLSPTTLTVVTVGNPFSAQLTAAGGAGAGYVFTGAHLPTWLTLSTAGLLSGMPTSASGAPFHFTVTATDDLGGTVGHTYALSVKPALAISPITGVAAVEDNFSTQLKATGGSGAGYAFTASGLPDWLTLSNTGLLSGMAPDTTGSPLAFTVSVTDSNSVTRSFPFALTIDPALALSPDSLSVATVGDKFTTQLTASGGSGAGYTFTGISLPTWLKVSSTGLLSGTPPATAGSSATFTVRITDSLKGTGGDFFTLVVDPALVLSPTTLTVVTVGDPFTTPLTAAGGSGAGYVFSGTGLPAWMTVSAAGVLSGTPTTATGSPFHFTITATDDLDGAVSHTYALSVNPALAVSPITGVATVGDQFTTQLKPTGGSGKGYSFTAAGLPVWLTLSSSGLLSGMPPAATGLPLNFTVTLTDSNGATGSHNYSLTIDSALTLSNLPTVATVGDVFRAQLTASGGSGAGYTYSAVNLPAGLHLTSAGLLSGTPTTATGSPPLLAGSPALFTVTAIDNKGGKVSRTYALIVNPAVVVHASTFGVATVGDLFSTQLTASGGAGAGYSFTAVSVPAGLTLSSTGLLSGIPTTASAAPLHFTVTASDSAGGTASHAFSLTVHPALVLHPSSLPTATVGDSYSTQLTASGGAGAGYTFTALNLPAGLTLSSAGLLAGKPTTAAGSPFNVTITATDSDGGMVSHVYSLKVSAVV